MRVPARLGLLVTLGACSGVSGRAPPGPGAPPPPSAPDVAMLARPRTVASYTLRASLDPAAHTVHGEGTLTFTNTSDKKLSELYFHLYLNAFKNQASVFMRAPIGGFRGTTVPKDWGTIDVRRMIWRDGDEARDLWGGEKM
jgi:hypothetical protein